LRRNSDRVEDALAEVIVGRKRFAALYPITDCRADIRVGAADIDADVCVSLGVFVRQSLPPLFGPAQFGESVFMKGVSFFSTAARSPPAAEDVPVVAPLSPPPDPRPAAAAVNASPAIQSIAGRQIAVPIIVIPPFAISSGSTDLPRSVGSGQASVGPKRLDTDGRFALVSFSNP
jgi:hypothetical protein